MKNLLIVVLVGVVAVMAVRSHRENRESIPSASKPAPEVPASNEAQPAPIQAAAPAPSTRLSSGTEYYEFGGTLDQHLADGRVLFTGSAKPGWKNGSQAYAKGAVYGFRSADRYPDGSVIKFTGVFGGTYEYITVTGANRTVREILVVPPEMLPEEKPGDWMWKKYESTPN